MIDKHEMFEPMVSACPSFKPIWQEFMEDAGRHLGEEPLYYVLLGDLGRHLLDLLSAQLTDEFPAAFDVVERWHLEGAPYVKEAATIGLLEGIQNNALHRNIDPRVFEPWLKPETKKWWDKLNRFWDGEVGALRDD